MIDADTTFTRSFHRFAGIRHYVAEGGAGRPLIFLHGGLADHRAALVHVGAAAGRIRVIAPDLRGSGRSVDAGPLDWDRLADDAAALCDHLGLERAVIGGVSMGSGVALRVGLRHPSRVAGLLLVWPAFAGAARGPTPAQRAACAAIEAAGVRARSEGIDALRPLYEGLPAPLRARALAMLADFDAASVAATCELLAMRTQPFAREEELAAIDAPTAIVPGVDPTHPAEVAALYARWIPGARVLGGAPEGVADEVVAFCAGARW